MRERELSACSIQKRKMNRYSLRQERHILLASSAVQQSRLTVRQGVRLENSKWYLRCCCRRLSPLAPSQHTHTLTLVAVTGTEGATRILDRGWGTRSRCRDSDGVMRADAQPESLSGCKGAGPGRSWTQTPESLHHHPTRFI